LRAISRLLAGRATSTFAQDEQRRIARPADFMTANLSLQLQPSPCPVFDHLETGDSSAEFLNVVPSVKREQVITLLKEAREQALTAS
jgi:predicted lipoprotein